MRARARRQDALSKAASAGAVTSPTTHAPLLIWLTPALLALLLCGLGQGFVKMWITEVPPARFWLYFACARAVVMICTCSKTARRTALDPLAVRGEWPVSLR